MKKIIVTFAAAAALIMAGCAGSSEKKTSENEVQQENVKEHNEQADGVASGKGVPVIMDFSAEWCPPCRQLKPVFHALGEEYKGKVDFVTVNVDSMPELAEMYKISSIPTLVFLSSEGEEIHRTVGFRTADEIKSDISSHFKN